MNVQFPWNRRTANGAAVLAVLVSIGSAAVASAQGATGTPPPAPVAPRAPCCETVVHKVTVEGWLGINYVAEQKQWVDRNELLVLHFSYPYIASVEPGSPADRAGLEAGDTIRAYNETDLKGKQVSLSKLLKPGSRLMVKVKRGTETYDLPITVGRRPETTRQAWYIEKPSAGTRVEVRERDRARDAQRALEPLVVSPSEPVTPVPAVPSLAAGYASGSFALAGAEVVRMNEDLGEIFGVARGLLVVAVGVNTPASRAGLRGGDVIVKVDGRTIATPRELADRLRRAEERQVRLVVVRKKKEQDVVLSWR